VSETAFCQSMLPEAERASAATGVDVCVILAQWGDETAWGTSFEFVSQNNVAGISPGGNLAGYATVADSVTAYIRVMLDPLYAAVRAPVGYVAQAIALGISPWSTQHYHGPGQPDGSSLLEIIADYNLTQYGAVVPPRSSPQPPSQPPEDAEMCYDHDRHQIHAVAVVNGIAYHWWQPTTAEGPLPAGVSFGVEVMKV
jgi:flagellum-specific peptidoglycan hydrolase FlgJ